MRFDFARIIAGAIGGYVAFYVYRDRPFLSVLSLLAVYAAYRTFVLYRAKLALQSMKRGHDNFARPRHELVDAKDVPAVAAKYFDRFAGELAEADFKFFFRYVNRAYAGGPGEMNYSAVYADEAHHTLVILNFVRKRRYYLFAFPLPFPSLTATDISCRVVNTHIEGPGRVVTTDLEMARAIPKRRHQFVEIVSTSKTVGQLVDLHQAQLNAALSDPSYSVLPTETPEHYFSFDEQFRRVSAQAHRKMLDDLVEKNHLQAIDPR